jgi:ComF family protein
MLSRLTALARTPLPSQCAVCRSWPSAPLCAACLLRFAAPRARCPQCALAWSATEVAPSCPHCQGQALPLQACFAAVDYAYPWADLLTRYKFQRQSGYSALLSDLLLRSPGVRECLASLSPQDCLLPMPLSAERLRERGFNQAWELTKTLHAHSGCQATPSPRLLLRLRHTQAQSGLPRQARLANVRGAFLVEPLAAASVRGRQVVLVDDVMTSGASLRAAALALLEAGASAVKALVVARTPP